MSTTCLPINPNEKFQDVPAECFRITGAVEFGDNGENAKTIPVRLVARSPHPIHHWYWGSIVHNLSGAFLRDGQSVTESSARINLDFAHGDSAVDIIGFANKFAITDEGLVLSGALTPMPEDFKGDDTARRVIHLAHQGVPFEASINFGGDGIKLRHLDEGETAMVNGHEFAGPGIVVDQWPLRNVAICSLGADGATKTELLSSGGDTITVELVSSEDPEMAEQAKQPIIDEELIPGSDSEASAVELSSDSDSEEAGDQPAVDSQTSLRQEGKRYIEAFGEVGAVMFVDGLSFEEACVKHIEQQNSKIEQLTNQLAATQAAAAGEDDACDFVEGDAPQKVSLVPEAERL